MVNEKIISERISAARKELGLTQTDLARKINMSPQNVSKWECGESLPDILTLNVIADVLGKKIDYFFSETINEQADIKSSQNSSESDILNQEKPFGTDTEKQDNVGTDSNSKKSTRLTFNNALNAWKGMDFSDTQLHNYNFKYAKFVGCNFNSTDFNETELPYTEFIGCDLDNANLSNCKIERADFKDCSFKTTKFNGATLKQSDFTGSNFENTVFQDVKQEATSYSGSSFEKIEFVKQDFKSASFKRASFINCSFIDCTFADCNFSGTSFDNCTADKISYNFMHQCKAPVAKLKII